MDNSHRLDERKDVPEPALLLLPHEIDPVLLAVIDFGNLHDALTLRCRRRRRRGREQALTQLSRKIHELVDHALGDVMVDDDPSTAARLR